MFFLIPGIILVSCHKVPKNGDDSLPSSPFTNVSQAFTWNTTRVIQLVADLKPYEQPTYNHLASRLNLAIENELGTACVLFSGAIIPGQPISVGITIPSGNKELISEVITPTGSVNIQRWPITQDMQLILESNPSTKTLSNLIDSDQDGITDPLDDFPSDAQLAFTYSYPASSGEGNLKDGTEGSIATWCFEDLWPSMGDFDMNDLVLNYSWVINTDANHFVRYIKGSFHIKAAGSCAIWKHGFGIEITGLPANQVSLTSGYKTTPGSPVQLDARGLEYAANGQVASPAIIIPFDDMSTLIDQPGTGFFNTIPGRQMGTAETVEVVIALVQPTTVMDSDINPGEFNPFLIRNQERGVEVHKADRIPTSLVNASLFGTSDDASDPASGKYYRTKQNLPWVIDIPMDFSYPAEWISIEEAYPEIVAWASGSGTTNQFWYQHPSSNSSTIYSFGGNRPPEALNVAFSGTPLVGANLSGSYTYSDPENDPEGNSLHQWYRADNELGLNEMSITGATSRHYQIQLADNGKYLRYGVIPKAQTGYPRGAEMKSESFMGPVTTSLFTCGNPLTDERDGKVYQTIQIGSQCWMKENLNYGTRVDGSLDQTDNAVDEKYCYDNLESNCDVYGGLYQWDEVMQHTTIPASQGICPPGWHVPTNAEYMALTAFLGYQQKVGCMIREAGTVHWDPPNIGATNSSGFTALPGGIRLNTNGQFYDLHQFIALWSSTNSTGGEAYEYNTYYTYEGISRHPRPKGFGQAVRCVYGDTTFPYQAPSVTIGQVTGIGEYAATFHGEVVNTGDAAVYNRGFCWSTTPNPTTSDPPSMSGSGSGSFEYTYGGLEPNTTYYVRAYAENGIGVAYSQELSFTTLPLIMGNACPDAPVLVDPRDGKTYETVLIGDQCWMAENLNYGTRIDGIGEQTNNSIPEKYCYNDLESNCDIYGGLYQWDELMAYATTQGTQGMCPAGWHLATNADWWALYLYVYYQAGLLKEAGTAHWFAPNTGATNSTGLTLLPGGSISRFSMQYMDLQMVGDYWTSTQTDADNAQLWLFAYNESHATRPVILKNIALSSRCIKGEQPTQYLPFAFSGGDLNITQTTATLGGTVISDGNSTVTVRGVCWSTSSNPTMADAHIDCGSGLGDFSTLVTGLLPNTLYHWRVYTTNASGTFYENGNNRFFTLP